MWQTRSQTEKPISRAFGCSNGSHGPFPKSDAAGASSGHLRGWKCWALLQTVWGLDIPENWKASISTPWISRGNLVQRNGVPNTTSSVLK